ncbi:MAG: hypothetical protein H0T78_03395 [Longispora sp.]|nr:hypothetical protein [Longispora sp. (in: high G+C Gram-positive bacteria)]
MRFTVLHKLSVLAGIYVIAFAPFSVEASAQVNTRAALTISFADGASVTFRTDRDLFYPVGVFPGETASMQLVVPPSLANTHLSIGALDGGAVTEDVIIGADGTASITFQAGTQPGLYRLLASAVGKTAMLQFWVFDAANPESNPPVVVRTPSAN